MRKIDRKSDLISSQTWNGYEHWNKRPTISLVFDLSFIIRGKWVPRLLQHVEEKYMNTCKCLKQFKVFWNIKHLKKQQKSRHIVIVLCLDCAKQRLCYLLFAFLRQLCLEILLAGSSARFISIPPLDLQWNVTLSEKCPSSDILYQLSTFTQASPISSTMCYFTLKTEALSSGRGV